MDNFLIYHINQGHQTLNLVNKDVSLNLICESIDYKTTTAPSAI